MVQSLGRKRSLRRRVIAENDQMVTIERLSRPLNAAGGRDDVRASLGPFRCRVVQRRMQMAGVESDPASADNRTNRWAALFEWNADVQAGGPDVVTDEFVAAPHGRFRVMEVVEETVDDGQLWGRTAELRHVE